jgi:hypothetical protein
MRHIFQAVAAFCFCFVESRGIGTLISQLKEAQGLEGVKGPMDWIVPRMLRYLDWIVPRMLRYMDWIVPRMLRYMYWIFPRMLRYMY